MGQIRIALLECAPMKDYPALRDFRGGFWNVYRDLLRASGPGVDFILDGYDVVLEQEYPDLSRAESGGGYRAVIVSGSYSSAYEDIPWINKLSSFIVETAKHRPNVKLIGTCFGHQILAHALGGRVSKNDRWEVGVTDVDLTELGKDLFQIDKPILSIEQMHGDHVSSAPPGSHLLGSTAATPVQGYIIPYDASRSLSEPSNIHVFSVQGHPEYDADVLLTLIDMSENGSHVLSPEDVREGRRKAVMPHDGITVGKTIWKILRVNLGDIFGIVQTE